MIYCSYLFADYLWTQLFIWYKLSKKKIVWWNAFWFCIQWILKSWTFTQQSKYLAGFVFWNCFFFCGTRKWLACIDVYVFICMIGEDTRLWFVSTADIVMQILVSCWIFWLCNKFWHTIFRSANEYLVCQWKWQAIPLPSRRELDHCLKGVSWVKASWSIWSPCLHMAI